MELVSLTFFNKGNITDKQYFMLGGNITKLCNRYSVKSFQ